jgi:hypothetical protein
MAGPERHVGDTYHWAKCAADMRSLDCRVEFVFGAPNTIRTCDPRLRRAVLYPAELWAQVVKLGEFADRITFFIPLVQRKQIAFACIHEPIQ